MLTTILDKFGIDYAADVIDEDEDEGLAYTTIRTDGDAEDHTGPSYCYAEFRFKKDGSFHDFGAYD
jgi:hypothetical protein